MCFESICGFSCPVALAVYYLPTFIIGFVALLLYLRRRGFFKRFYVRLLRFLRRFAVVPVAVLALSSFADCTPMTYEECTSATNSLHQSADNLLSVIGDMQYSVDNIRNDNSIINTSIQNWCMTHWDNDLCGDGWNSSGNIYGSLDSLDSNLSYLNEQVNDIQSSINSISCCSSNGGNDGGGGGNDGGGSSCTNCACAEQILAIKTKLDSWDYYLQQYYIWLQTIKSSITTLNNNILDFYTDNNDYWDGIALLDDSYYTYLKNLRTSVQQLRNNVLPSRVPHVNFANILQGQAFIYSAEYKTQLLTELFGNTITQQLAQAFRLSRAFGEYEDGKDWLGIVNPEWQAAMDAYTNGGDGDGSMDDWIKGDSTQTNYFARLETYNQQIVKFLALMNRTNDLETTSTDNPYAEIDTAYEEAEQRASSDVSGTSSELEGLKSPFQRLYDCFTMLRSSLEIQNPSSTTSFRWVPDNIDFSQQGINSESQGLTLDLSESSYLGRGVALFNSLFGFVWVVLCVVVCGYLAFRAVLVVRWIFTFLFALVSKIGDR